jgi:hypothetical protein
MLLYSTYKAKLRYLHIYMNDIGKKTLKLKEKGLLKQLNIAYEVFLLDLHVTNGFSGFIGI